MCQSTPGLLMVRASEHFLLPICQSPCESDIFFGDFFLRCQHPLSACEVCVGALVVSVCSLFLCKLCVFVCYIFFSRFSLLPFSVPSD